MGRPGPGTDIVIVTELSRRSNRIRDVKILSSNLITASVHGRSHYTLQLAAWVSTSEALYEVPRETIARTTIEVVYKQALTLGIPTTKTKTADWAVAQGTIVCSMRGSLHLDSVRLAVMICQDDKIHGKEHHHAEDSVPSLWIFCPCIYLLLLCPTKSTIHKANGFLSALPTAMEAKAWA